MPSRFPQVALLYSTAAHYRESNGLFPRDLSRIKGTLQALLEGQQSVEVVGEHQLTGRMGEYPLIIVPECAFLESGFKEELLAYARGGGHLLLIGPQTAALFARELGIVPDGPIEASSRFLAHGDSLAPDDGACPGRPAGAGREGGRPAPCHAGRGHRRPCLPRP